MVMGEIKKEILKSISFSFGGIERIRTAVGAFAEPSLATRPRRHNCLDGKFTYYLQ